MRRYPAENYLIAGEVSIRDALQRIEQTERRTLFVVDEQRRLRGAVTDGDIRRWLLAGGGIAAALREVANREPLSAQIGFDREVLRERMIERGAMCVPLLDDERRVIDIIFWEDVVLGHDAPPSQPPVDVPVIIMAGGRGTRMMPFSQVLPKPLLPIGEKTIIEIIIDRFVDCGARDFIVTLNYKANLIRAFFQDLARAYEVEFVEEPRPLGTAGSLGLIPRTFATPVILTNCDIIVRADCHDVVMQHKRRGDAITLVASLKRYQIPYGVCEIENGGELKGMTEKPEYDLMVNTGMYILSPEVFRHIPPEKVFHMTDLIEAVRAAGGRVGVYPISDWSWADAGEWEEYRRTVGNFESLVTGRRGSSS